jgi:hypothetical protein
MVNAETARAVCLYCGQRAPLVEINDPGAGAVEYVEIRRMDSSYHSRASEHLFRFSFSEAVIAQLDSTVNECQIPNFSRAEDPIKKNGALFAAYSLSASTDTPNRGPHASITLPSRVLKLRAPATLVSG